MITIRDIRAADIEPLRELLDHVCRERKYLAMLEAPTAERFSRFIHTNIERGYPQVVAEYQGKVVGWCDAVPGEEKLGTAHVGRLGMGVARDFRGRGIGRLMLRGVIEKAHAVGLEKIELSVYASNKSAIALYQNSGFVEEGRKKRGRLVDGLYDDVVLMGLFLRKA